MPSRRLARALGTFSPPRNPGPPSSLIPPYSHAKTVSPSPPPSLLPPYAHALRIPSPSLIAPYRFSLTTSSSLSLLRSEHWNTWAALLIETHGGRERVWRLWVETIIELEKMKSTGGNVPEVSFHSLGEHLRSAGTLDAVQGAGVLVVRDVVPDVEASGWARDLLEALRVREGRAVYWHDALVAARAHPSVLSANNQVLKALSGVETEALIQADTAQEGLGSDGARTTSLDQAWAVDSNALCPSTPILSHLALTPSTSSRLSPTIHAALYASLRPLFEPVRSRISFYSPSAYLDPANWQLRDPSTLPTNPPSETPAFPHLAGTEVAVPRLLSGDIVLRNASLPVHSDGGQVFLPVSPLPRTSGNEEYIAKQKEAFEAGLPPPHVGGDGELVALEETGSVGRISSSGGRRAMGYGA